MAIISQKQPTRVIEFLGYQGLIIRHIKSIQKIPGWDMITVSESRQLRFPPSGQ